MNKYIIILLATIISLMVSCKKKKENNTCPSQLYGNSFGNYYSSLLVPKSNIGILDLSAKKFAGYAAIPYVNNDRESCFNPDDDCYYMLQPYFINYTAYSVLYKVEKNGSIIGIKTTDSSFYNSLAYNQKLHKFYCIRNNKIGEISISGSSFTTKDLTAPVHAFIQTTASITTDNTTGDMYYITSDKSRSTDKFYIEKYNPGNALPVVVSGINSIFREPYHIWELCYNKADKMLYGLKIPDAVVWPTIIKIDPVTGTITQLQPLSAFFDTSGSSSCIDPCNNRYILSVGGSLVNSSLLISVNLDDNTATVDTLACNAVRGLNFK